MPWSKMWKRNQSMMAVLANYDFVNRVIFINPFVSTLRMFFLNNGEDNFPSSACDKFFPKKAASKLFVHTPKYILPRRKFPIALKSFESKIVAKILLKSIARLNHDMPYILFMNCPNIFSNRALDVLLKNAKLSVFDFSDDFLELGFGHSTLELFKRNVENYASAANLVLAVNDHIKHKYGYLNPNIHSIRNATNYYNFDRKKYESIDFFEKLKNKKDPIIGYCGIASNNRMDTNIIDFLLEKQQNWQYVFIGTAESDLINKYLPYKNFFHIPPVDYIDLPNYLQYFDVAIVPFKINEHTRGNDLLKFHDFLAMGKPVVTTEVGGATDLADVVEIAQNPSDFLNLIEKALLDESNENLLHRKRCAQKNSWPERIAEFTDLLQSYL